MKALAIALTAALLLAACDAQPSTTEKEAAAQNKLTAEANAQVGLPAVLNFTEKRNYKMIYELRDQPNYATKTYIVDMNGHFHKLCDSVGYGIPESSQYTNPSVIADSQHQTGYAILPQADPNGLYSSPSANGTWVMCLDPSGKVVPVRSEPNVITSPFPLQ